MRTTPIVTLRMLPDEDAVEITLRRGFTPTELAVVRTLPGRTYDADRYVWTVPDAARTIATLRSAYGTRGVKVMGGRGGVGSPGDGGEGARTVPAPERADRTTDRAGGEVPNGRESGGEPPSSFARPARCSSR